VARVVQRRLAHLVSLGGIVLALSTPAAADPTSDRQVLAVFTSGTVTLADAVDSAEVAQAMSLESEIGQILTSFGIQQIARAFPEFDRADTVGVAYTGETVQLTDWSKVWLVTLPEGGSPDSLIAALQASASTVFAEPNGTGQGLGAPKYPNDPYFKDGSQWGLWTPAVSGLTDADTNAPWAWGDTTGTPLINIGVIDGGFTGSHPDLGARVVSNDGQSLSSA